MRAEVEHPPVADEDDLGQAEAVAQLVDLGLEGRRVGGVAGERLDRDRAALPVGQQAEHDLGPVRAGGRGCTRGPQAGSGVPSTYVLVRSYSTSEPAPR